VPPRSTSGSDAPSTPTAPQNPAAPGGATPYTVADTDTLSTIAKAHYGDVKYWPAIVAANPGMDPDRIRIGQVIQLPPKADVLAGKVKPRAEGNTPADSARPVPSPSGETRPGAPPATPAPAPASGVRIYRVQKGDTLSSIAHKELRDESRWMEIFELNKDQLASPDTVVEGMELKLPEK
jgi:nucleoid-associated protein YgaU